MLNRLLNSTGKKLRLYVAAGAPMASTSESQAAPAAEPTAPRRKATPKHDVAQPATPRSLAEALGYVAECTSPAEGLAVLEAAGLSAQRAAIMGGISLAAYDALHSVAGTAPEWLAFRRSVAEWRDRLTHSATP